MPTSDEHLESALAEYNEKIFKLESEGGSDEEFVEAYINRGCILAMLEYRTVAISDFKDAIDVMDHMDASGKGSDAGAYVKACISLGQVENDVSAMCQYYLLASNRLREVRDMSRHCPRKSLIRMCLDCAGDLIDNGHPESVGPFIDRAWGSLIGKEDPWSRNRYAEAMGLKGEAEMALEEKGLASESFTDCINAALELMDKGLLEDEGLILLAYSMRAECNMVAKDSSYLSDKSSALLIAEELMKENHLDDPSIVSDLHKQIAEYYMSKNMMKEAEEHLMKVVALDMSGARNYIENVARRPGE